MRSDSESDQTPGAAATRDAGAPWALVTGGSRGIGGAVVLELASRGWNVAVAYLQNEDAAGEMATSVRSLGREAVAVPANLIKPDQRKELMARVSEVTDRLHGLVHAAGLGASAPTLGARPSRWTLAWESHVASLVDLIQQGRHLLHGPAAIVLFSSLGAHRVMEGYAPIGVAKGALETLTRYLAADLGQHAVTVNCICAGPVDTDSLRSFPTFDALEQESRKRLPGRLGRPEDIAPLAAFLMSPDARWIQGQVIVADGGLGLA